MTDDTKKLSPWSTIPIRSQAEVNPGPIRQQQDRLEFNLPRHGANPGLPRIMRPIDLPPGGREPTFYCTINGVTSVSTDGIRWTELPPRSATPEADRTAGIGLAGIPRPPNDRRAVGGLRAALRGIIVRLLR